MRMVSYCQNNICLSFHNCIKIAYRLLSIQYESIIIEYLPNLLSSIITMSSNTSNPMVLVVACKRRENYYGAASAYGLSKLFYCMPNIAVTRNRVPSNSSDQITEPTEFNVEVPPVTFVDLQHQCTDDITDPVSPKKRHINIDAVRIPCLPFRKVLWI